MQLQSVKVITINVLVTFVEGFAPAWALSGNQLTKSALAGAGAAGLSVLWNTLIKPWLKARGILYNKV